MAIQPSNPIHPLRALLACAKHLSPPDAAQVLRQLASLIPAQEGSIRRNVADALLDHALAIERKAKLPGLKGRQRIAAVQQNIDFVLKVLGGRGVLNNLGLLFDSDGRQSLEGLLVKARERATDRYMGDKPTVKGKLSALIKGKSPGQKLPNGYVLQPHLSQTHQNLRKAMSQAFEGLRLSLQGAKGGSREYFSKKEDQNVSRFVLEEGKANLPTYVIMFHGKLDQEWVKVGALRSKERILRSFVAKEPKAHAVIVAIESRGNPFGPGSDVSPDEVRKYLKGTRQSVLVTYPSLIEEKTVWRFALV